MRHLILDKKEDSLMNYVKGAQTLKDVFKKIKKNNLGVILSDVCDSFEILESRKDFAIISEDYMPEGIYPYGSEICYYLIR